MGINTHVYTVYGVKLPWDDAFYEAYEEIEEALCDEFGYGKPKPADRQIEAIMDGMGGEYMVLGPILYDSGDFRYCVDMNNYQEIDEVGMFGRWLKYKKQFDELYPEIDEVGMFGRWLKYKKQFDELYPEHKHLLTSVGPKLINFIHYS